MCTAVLIHANEFPGVALNHPASDTQPEERPGSSFMLDMQSTDRRKASHVSLGWSVYANDRARYPGGKTRPSECVQHTFPGFCYRQRQERRTGGICARDAAEPPYNR